MIGGIRIWLGRFASILEQMGALFFERKVQDLTTEKKSLDFKPELPALSQDNLCPTDGVHPIVLKLRNLRRRIRLQLILIPNEKKTTNIKYL